MKEITNMLKLLSDSTRLRIVMVLTGKELCVCQIMGVLDVSQSLISKNLRLLAAAGVIEERKKGKLVFYSLKRDMPPSYGRLIILLSESMEDDETLKNDRLSLKECEEFQKITGKCDMKTFKEFMNRKKTNATSKGEGRA